MTPGEKRERWKWPARSRGDAAPLSPYEQDEQNDKGRLSNLACNWRRAIWDIRNKVAEPARCEEFKVLIGRGS